MGTELKRLIAEIKRVLSLDPVPPAVKAYGGALVLHRVLTGLPDYRHMPSNLIEMKFREDLIAAGLWPTYYPYEGEGTIVRADAFPPPRHLGPPIIDRRL